MSNTHILKRSYAFLVREAIVLGAIAVIVLLSNSLLFIPRDANAESSVQHTPPNPGENNPASFSPLSPSDNASALNWAGYVASGGTYTSVSGSWIVPNVGSNETSNDADATWVGIGGTSSHDLIQAGTEALPTSDGRIVYQAWYETLPQETQAVPMAISPGDTISVSVTKGAGNAWVIAFNDSTSGRSYQTTVNYASSLSSAEWIEEMPVEIGGLIGLDDFGTIDFSNGYAIKNGSVATIATSGSKALTMTNSSGAVIATPSALGTDGASFSVSRTDALATPLALTEGGVRAVAVAPFSSTSASQSAYSVSNGSPGFARGSMRVIRRSRGGYRIIVRF
jgi:hypothetical protein